MNNFTTETIISTDLFSGANGVLSVKKVGNYKAANVVSVFKNPGTEAVKEVGTLAITAAGTAGATLRLEVVCKQIGAHTAEFANSLTRSNKILEFELASDTAVEMAKAIEASVKAQNRDTKNVHFVVTRGENAGVDDATLTFTAVDEYIHFESIVLQELVPSTTGFDSFTVVKEGTITTPGKVGFGTTRWINQHLRIPTLANTGWTALYQDERPVAGGLYTQFSLKQAVNRGELQGNGAVGQEMTSVTNHIFYVLSTVVPAFEAACANAGIAIDTVGVEATDITLGAVSIGAAVAGIAIPYTTTPAGITGATFVRLPSSDTVAGTLVPAKVTVTAAGKLKIAAESGLDAGDKLGFTVTIDGVSLTKTVTLTA